MPRVYECPFNGTIGKCGHCGRQHAHTYARLLINGIDPAKSVHAECPYHGLRLVEKA
jgi:hypothetical protein